MSSEPTLTEALSRIKKEIASTAGVLAILMGGGGWFGFGEVEKSEKAAAASDRAASVIATHYVPALASCEMRFAEQRKVCLALLESEKENTAQWRAECGR